MKHAALFPLTFLFLAAGAQAQEATGTATLTDSAGNPVIVTSHHARPAQEDLQAEFAALDRDGDGGVSPREARVDKYLARSFRLLDADRDGHLQFE